MLRFLLSILILGIIIWGIWNFVSPVIQLANIENNTRDDFTDTLTAAMERSWIEKSVITSVFRKNTIAWDKTATHDSEQKDSNLLKTRNLEGFGQWNRSTSTSQTQQVRKYIESWENSSDAKLLAYEKKNLSTRWNAFSNQNKHNIKQPQRDSQDLWPKGFFGTPAISRHSIQKSLHQEWWLLINPLLEVVSLERSAVWLFGWQEIRRNVSNVCYTPFFFM